METKKRKPENPICNVIKTLQSITHSPSSIQKQARMLKELCISNPKGESISKTETTALLSKRLKKILKQKGRPSVIQ